MDEMLCMVVNVTLKEGPMRMVPRLKEIHIVRDSWTKLNVTLAKDYAGLVINVCRLKLWPILQQDVLYELYH